MLENPETLAEFAFGSDALDEKFHGHFCPRRKAAKFCRPVFEQLFTKTGKYVYTLFEGLRVCSLG